MSQDRRLIMVNQVLEVQGRHTSEKGFFFVVLTNGEGKVLYGGYMHQEQIIAFPGTVKYQDQSGHEFSQVL
jgi:hypothetical protein